MYSTARSGLPGRCCSPSLLKCQSLLEENVFDTRNASAQSGVAISVVERRFGYWTGSKPEYDRYVCSSDGRDDHDCRWSKNPHIHDSRNDEHYVPRSSDGPGVGRRRRGWRRCYQFNHLFTRWRWRRRRGVLPGIIFHTCRDLHGHSWRWRRWWATKRSFPKWCSERVWIY